MGVTPALIKSNEGKITTRPAAGPLDPIATGSRALFALKEKVDRVLLVTKHQLYFIPNSNIRQ